MTNSKPYCVPTELAGQTLAAVVRAQLPGSSWSQVAKQIERSAVRVNQVACLDAARRMKVGDLVEIGQTAAKLTNWSEQVRLLHVDHHLAVVEKPTGLLTERRPEERNWSARRKAIHPTLDEVLPNLLADSRTPRRGQNRNVPRVILVHRLDRDTSGVLVVARTTQASLGLTHQFRQHTAQRVYRAVVVGHPGTQTIQSRFVRDRGDGLRGSVEAAPVGKDAITHVRELERIGPYSVIECRLETGRTNQIRIHLAERDCLVCGDVKYNRRLDGSPFTDDSQAPRLALHAMELEFVHPISQQAMKFLSPCPADLEHFILRLRQTTHATSS